jgi:CheY-like chemotaxis protein
MYPYNAMAVVLCVGTIEGLMESRRLIIEKAGHNVIPAKDENDVVRACKTQPIKVAVLGQMLPAPNKIRAFDLLRQHCPNVKVLSLYSPATGRVLPNADDWLAVPADVPSDLAERVSKLADK